MYQINAVTPDKTEDHIISNEELVEILKVVPHFSILGLDIGIKKIGIAFYSTAINLTLAIQTLQRSTNLHKDIDIIANIAEEKQICAIVIGLPLRMNSQPSSLVKPTMEIIAKIKEKIPSILITLFDERFTTAMADRMLKEIGQNRKQRNMRDDEIAAAILLEDFIKRFTKSAHANQKNFKD